MRWVKIGKRTGGISGGIRIWIVSARRVWSFSRDVRRRRDWVRDEGVGWERRWESRVRRVSSIGWKRIRAINEPGLANEHR